MLQGKVESECSADKLGMFLSSIYILNNFLQCLSVTGNSNSPKKYSVFISHFLISETRSLGGRAIDKKGVGGVWDIRFITKKVGKEIYSWLSFKNRQTRFVFFKCLKVNLLSDSCWPCSNYKALWP